MTIFDNKLAASLNNEIFDGSFIKQMNEISSDIKSLEKVLNENMVFCDFDYRSDDEKVDLIWRQHGKQFRLFYIGEINSQLMERLLGDCPAQIRLKVAPYLPLFVQKLALYIKEQ